MAIGNYGTIRPADVSPEDVEIILNYTPSRDETQNFLLTKLNSKSVLRPYFNNSNTGGNANVLAQYKFKDIFPTSISAIDLSYDTTDTIEEFTVEFQINFWYPEAPGSNTAQG